MSCLEVMKIQGIRSFSSDRAERITFEKPLTVICGPNGAGKTTIIECLKYACTGEMPPNCNKGHLFVRDPSLSGKTDSSAKVHLRFRNIKGDLMDCVRNMQLLAKPNKKYQFSVQARELVHVDSHGQRMSSRPYKCADIDTEMPILLGISKPILDNVVFCHQEVSNWPLADPKELKARFDDIFAATRYTKALETLRKQQRASREKVLELQAKHDVNLTKKEEMERIRERLMNEQAKLAELAERAEAVAAELARCKADVERAEALTKPIRELEDELKELAGQLTAQRKVQEDLEKKVDNYVDGSLADLEKLNKQAQDGIQANRAAETRVLDAARLLTETMQAEEAAVAEAMREAESLNRELGAFEGNLRRLRESRTTLAARFTIALDAADNRLVASDDSSSASEVIEVMVTFGKRLERVRAENDEQVERESRADAARQQEKRRAQTAAAGELANVQSALRSLNDRINEKTRAMEERQTRCRAAVDNAHLEQLTDNLKTLDNRIERARAEFNEERLDADAQTLRAESEGLEAAIKELEARVDACQRRASEFAVLRSKQELLRDKIDARERALREARPKWAKVLGDEADALNSSDLAAVEARLAALYRELKDESTAMDADVQQRRTGLADLRASQQQLRQQLDDMARERTALTDSLGELAGIDFAARLAEVEEQQLSAVREQSTVGSMTHLYRRYLEMTPTTHSCPLCHRQFPDDEALQAFLAELEEKFQRLPSAFSARQTMIDQLNGELKRLRDRRADWQRLQEIDDRVPTAQVALDDDASEITAQTEQLEQLEQRLKRTKSRASGASDALQSLPMLVGLQADVEALEAEIQNLRRASAAAGDDGEALEEMQARLKAQREANRTTSAKLEQLRQDSASARKLLSQLHSDRTALAAKVAEATQSAQMRARLVEEIAALRQECSALEAEAKAVEPKLERARAAERAVSDELQVLEREMRVKQAEQQKRSTDIASECTSFAHTLSECRAFMRSARKDELLAVRRRLDERKSALEATREQNNAKQAELTRLRDQIARNLKVVATLQSNIDLMRAQERLAEIEGHRDEVQRKLNSPRWEGVIRGVRDAERAFERVVGEKAALQGEIKAHMETERELQKDLNSDANRRLEGEIAAALIDLTTLKLAMEDINRYALALEAALMRFHSLKMSEINAAIKRLWTSTYRGQDIDEISIVSDIDSATSSTTTRNFNYRVVMNRHGTELDMRGRCSAGQKVLASLVIRLALAETFCINCGLLALDEPTTNLDHENIESFAAALSDLVYERRGQQNFQLIVITHDEDFVEMLGRHEFCEKFVRVSRSSTDQTTTLRQDFMTNLR